MNIVDGPLNSCRAKRGIFSQLGSDMESADRPTDHFDSSLRNSQIWVVMERKKRKKKKSKKFGHYIVGKLHKKQKKNVKKAQIRIEKRRKSTQVRKSENDPKKCPHHLSVPPGQLGQKNDKNNDFFAAHTR